MNDLGCISTQKFFCSVKPLAVGAMSVIGLPSARPGVTDDCHVAGLRRALHRLETHPLLAQRLERSLNISVRDACGSLV